MIRFWYFPVSAILLIIGINAAIDFITFLAINTEIKTTISQFFPSLTSSIYNADDFEMYSEKLNETNIALMHSIIDIRSIPSAIICLITGVLLLINPIRESIEDFVKSLFKHYFT